MKSREEIIKEIRESSNGSWDDMITEGFEAGIKYAQQSQPSPAGAAEGEFTLSFCDKCIQMTNHKLVCQKCKPASEGISKIREVMNWISQCVDEDHNLEVSEIKMIWNDLSDAISLIESSHVVSSGEGMAEAWVIEYDNDTGPGDEYFVEWFNVTNGEKSFRCNSKEDAEFLLASLSPGVEDGSGWVSIEDAKPDSRLSAVLVCNNWAPEHKRCVRTALWFGQTKQFVMDCNNAFTTHEISHWRPLPTPPGVEDNQTKKQ